MAATRRRWLEVILDIIFPPRCGGCGRRGVWLCGECVSRLQPILPPVCRYCGKPTGGVSTCPDCWLQRPSLDGVSSAFVFEEPLRGLIHRFKYRHARHLAAPLAELLTGRAATAAEVIVPVPLYPKRERQRGYNQALLLAEVLAPALGLPLVADSLRRVKDTPPQMGLPAAERHRNVRGAFACADRQLNGRHVLLLDDVCTTGATLNACAVALKKAGARAVSGLTVARAR